MKLILKNQLKQGYKKMTWVNLSNLWSESLDEDNLIESNWSN